MPKKRPGRHWAATTLCSVLALHAAGALAADITVTPAGGGFVVKGGNQERLRVQGTGEVYVPGLSSTGTSNTLTCYDAGTGQLTRCAPGVGGGATGSHGPPGPHRGDGPCRRHGCDRCHRRGRPDGRHRGDRGHRTLRNRCYRRHGPDRRHGRYRSHGTDRPDGRHGCRRSHRGDRPDRRHGCDGPPGHTGPAGYPGHPGCSRQHWSDRSHRGHRACRYDRQYRRDRGHGPDGKRGSTDQDLGQRCMRRQRTQGSDGHLQRGQRGFGWMSHR